MTKKASLIFKPAALLSLLACLILVAVVAVNTHLVAAVDKKSKPSCSQDLKADCLSQQFDSATSLLKNLRTPTISISQPNVGSKPTRVLTYHVETRGTITASLGEFKSQAASTLGDARGWGQLKIKFKEVATGGDYTLVLSQASQMTTFSATGCDTTYSCQVGKYVIINQDRWLKTTPSWTNAGGSLRDYRHMVINHETGHYLGHGHLNCSGKGQLAPLMQQQSIDLQGCKFNAWPLSSELWSRI